MSGMNFDVDSIARNKQEYPDQYLVNAIHGSIKGLPPIIAMMAGQRRQELMTAGQGAQAQQAMKQGTVKDKIAAELHPHEQYAGLAALPAENMAGMDEQTMAAGGIIAFKDEGLVPLSTPAEDEYPIFNVGDTLSNIVEGMKNNWEKNKAINEGRYNAPNAVSQGSVANRDAYRSAPAGAVAPAGGVNFDPTAGGNPAVAALSNKQQGGIGAPPAAAPGQQGIADLQAPKSPDRFAGLGETQEAFDKKVSAEKSASQNEFLMNMGLKMMTTVGPLGKAIGEGGIAALPGLANSRKTIRELEQHRSDYQLNMAKAQTAADQGDADMAYKYKALAEKTAHDAGMLAVERTKAQAYAGAVGSKADQAERYKREEILKGFEARLKQMPLYATATPDKRKQMEQEAMSGAIQGYNDATAALSGKGPVNISGISNADIDAAIARKQK